MIFLKKYLIYHFFQVFWTNFYKIISTRSRVISIEVSGAEINEMRLVNEKTKMMLLQVYHLDYSMFRVFVGLEIFLPWYFSLAS